MASEHIYKQFDSDLEAIRAKVLEMGTLVEEQTANAVKSLIETDIKLAEQVMKRDDQINDLELAIDEEASLLIAKRSPAAGDLRNIMMMLKIITDLERMGDEAAKIARSTTRIFEDNRMSKPRFIEIKGMAKAVKDMIKTALNSFARLDLSDTIDILEKDKQVDDDYRSCMRQLLTFMLEDPRTISMSLESMFIAKSLERIGDHAVNISQSVIYTVKGKDVRHSSLKEIKKELS
ncbi:phosphate signaling complex protein PhoU [Methylophilaceae bacterium]|jgi:phosphate transport system protein|nr:phosphate signaling complex protein PhoU [Methylophilaceae bacterium]|tara:strand:- start:873 stop:1574 length:702 start_codon:yes stop_codon:yes gene_type:complete